MKAETQARLLTWSLLLLNTIDGIATFVWALTGRASEWNPLLHGILAVSAFGFLLLKLLVVNAIILILGAFISKYAWVRFMAGVVFVLYLLTIVAHLLVFI